MSASDAEDGSSTGTEVPRMWVLLMLPRFGGAKHANGHNHWSQHRQVVFQVHGIDAEGKVLIRRQLKRRYVLAFFQKLTPCLVATILGAP